MKSWTPGDLLYHKPECCALRDESVCCCVEGVHEQQYAKAAQKYMDLPAGQIRERYWLSQWRTDEPA